MVGRIAVVAEADAAPVIPCVSSIAEPGDAGLVHRDGPAVIESRARMAFLGRSRREGAIDLLFLLPILVILAAFLVYPLVYGIVLSLHDTQGLRAHELRRARPLRARDLRRRRLPSEPAEHVPVHRRSGRAPDGRRAVPCRARRRREAREDVLPDRVLRAIRPCLGRGRRGLEVPVRALLRDRGHRRVGPRVPHADDRAARGRRTPRCGRSWSPSCGGSPASSWSCISRRSRALPREYYEYAVLEGAGRFAAVPADHLAAAVATDVHAGPADHARDAADLRHGVGHDRGRSLARHRDRRNRRLRRPRSGSFRSAMRRRWR